MKPCFALGLAVAALIAPAVVAETPAAPAAFTNGGLWPDNHGVHINSHGGGLLHHDGRWYWYGEHKVAGDAGNYAQVGVSVYTSPDLVRWQDAGIALPVSAQPGHDIEKGCILERPKVIYNARTRKFVMWFHLELKGKGYSAARVGVATADAPTGPFTFVRSFRPNAGHWPANLPESLRKPLNEGELKRVANAHAAKHAPDSDLMRDALILRRDFTGGQMSRDMTLYVDTDGAAYHLTASEENGTLHISKLTDDYLDTTGDYRRVFAGRYHEAPAIVKARGKYWLISSDCTGWWPNPARLSSAAGVFGPWTEHGNPCAGPTPAGEPPASITFGGQSTYATVLPGPGERVLVMFDRWRPKDAIDGRHVWLLAEFDKTTGRPALRWADTWPPAAAPQAR